jgi:hypothetical protein
MTFDTNDAAEAVGVHRHRLEEKWRLAASA